MADRAERPRLRAEHLPGQADPPCRGGLAARVQSGRHREGRPASWLAHLLDIRPTRVSRPRLPLDQGAARVRAHQLRPQRLAAGAGRRRGREEPEGPGRGQAAQSVRAEDLLLPRLRLPLLRGPAHPRVPLLAGAAAASVSAAPDFEPCLAVRPTCSTRWCASISTDGGWSRRRARPAAPPPALRSASRSARGTPQAPASTRRPRPTPPSRRGPDRGPSAFLLPVVSSAARPTDLDPDLSPLTLLIKV